MLKKIVKVAKREINNYKDVNYDHLTLIKFCKSNVENDHFRLNLVLPKVDKKYVFGGISTAFTFFNKLAETLNAEKRVIAIDKPLSKNNKKEYPNYVLKNASVDNKDLSSVMVSVDSKWRQLNKLPVRKNDIFITTSWDTHFIFANVPNFQKTAFNKKNNIIYLIQDFEPGFANWSSDYVLADSTYKTGNTIAVFNSINLKEYMNKHGYSFDKELYFNPVLNASMAKILKDASSYNVERENNVLLYGRPSTSRNCFEVAVKSLKVLVQNYNLKSKWNFISIGEKHRDIDLGKGYKLRSLGKLSLENYSKLLLKSKVGISLMCSPHPSYPPLEMSTFGMKTITNSFECKDLTDFNSNIISVDNLDYNNLAYVLFNTINSNNQSEVKVNSSYVNYMGQFDDILKYFKEIYN